MRILKKPSQGALMSKLVTPNGDSDQPQVRVVPMQTAIPAHEEPVLAIMVIACKSQAVYVGHVPGAEAVAHQLCLDGAQALHVNMQQRLAALVKEKEDSRILPVGTTLANLGLVKPGQADA